MKTLAVLGATVAAVMGTSTASATELLYTLYGVDDNGAVEFSSWHMNSNPMVADYMKNVFFEVDDIQGTFNYGDRHVSINNLSFYHLGAYAAGVSTLFDLEGIVDIAGPQQLYTGPESAPTMLTGVFQVHDYYSSAPLQLSVASVPEATSWAMMLAGFGLVGFALRARRTTVRFARR